MSRFSRIISAVFLLPFTLLPLFFIGLGGFQMWQQDHKMDTYLPAKAVIQSANISTRQRHSRRGTYTVYVPSVHYQFVANNHTYTASGLLPLRETSGTSAWAHGIVDRFTPGASCTAWYNPSNPPDAFIVRRYRFIPAAVVLFAMPFVFFFTAGIGYGTLAGWSRPLPRDVGGGRYELRPRCSLTPAWLIPACGAAVWYLAAMLAVGDYCGRIGGPPPVLGSIGVVIYLLLGLIPLRMAVKNFRISRHTRTPHVAIDTPTPEIGGLLNVLVAQDFLDDLESEVAVGLVCKRTTGSGKSSKTVTAYEHDERVDSLSGRSAKMRVASVAIEVPSPHSPGTFKSWSRRDEWFIRVTTRFENGAKYEALFPLTIAHPAGGESRVHRAGR